MTKRPTKIESEVALSDEDLADSRDSFFIHPQLLPGSDRPIANQDNDYLIDRALQASGGAACLPMTRRMVEIKAVNITTPAKKSHRPG